MSCQPGPEALTWSDPTSTQKPPDSLTGLGQRNRVTAISEERSQTSYQRCSGKVQKGSPAPLTCVHRRLSGMLFQLRVLGAPSSRRPEVCSKLGGPGAENLEVRWRPENCDPAGCAPSTRGLGPSRPQATGAAAASAARCARAAAAHWCGTTIGTSLRFCLQSNPAIKRGAKSPLITPCHKVICPGGKP